MTRDYIVFHACCKISELLAPSDMCFTDPDHTNREPTTLWRLAHPDSATARATIIPGLLQQTLAWFVDDVLDRVENFNDTASALARSDGSGGS